MNAERIVDYSGVGAVVDGDMAIFVGFVVDFDNCLGRTYGGWLERGTWT